jgi:hypothetical protein
MPTTLSHLNSCSPIHHQISVIFLHPNNTTITHSFPSQQSHAISYTIPLEHVEYRHMPPEDSARHMVNIFKLHTLIPRANDYLLLPTLFP